MNEESQRVAIAEACGWTDIALAHDEADTDALNPVGLRNGRGCLHQRIPDYLNDLNAMHEAVFYLTPLQRCQLQQRLGKICEKHKVCFCEALPRWWAEAFLRTIGMWEDGK